MGGAEEPAISGFSDGHYLAIITAYLPNGGLWSDDYRKRIKT